VISLIWDLTTAKRKKICPYYQGQSWTKYVFQRCIDYVDIAGRPPLGVYNHALMSRALKPLRQLGFLVYVLALRLNDAIWIRTQPAMVLLLETISHGERVTRDTPNLLLAQSDRKSGRI